LSTEPQAESAPVEPAAEFGKIWIWKVKFPYFYN
jgi:hypothetical protein